jgi:hypothetical protein
MIKYVFEIPNDFKFTGRIAILSSDDINCCIDLQVNGINWITDQIIEHVGSALIEEYKLFSFVENYEDSVQIINGKIIIRTEKKHKIQLYLIRGKKCLNDLNSEECKKIVSYVYIPSQDYVPDLLLNSVQNGANNYLILTRGKYILSSCI